MKILVVGGTGTLGSAIVQELSQRHEVIIAAHRSGSIHVDITSEDSIAAMYRKLGQVDAVVAATGQVHFGPLIAMRSSEYQKGLRSKLMGQVNLVLLGLEHLSDRGSFTLTSGILSHDPCLHGSSASMVNGALESFTLAAATEMPRGIRINTVSPTVLTESMPLYQEYFRGYAHVPAAKAASAYSKSVEGVQTGQIYRIWS